VEVPQVAQGLPLATGGVVAVEGLEHARGVADHREREPVPECVVRGVPAAAVGVLTGEHQAVDAPHEAGGGEVGLGERRVVPLADDDVRRLGRLPSTKSLSMSRTTRAVVIPVSLSSRVVAVVRPEGPTFRAALS
jgi:hypothetical protein